MPSYVTLFKWTEQGISDVKGTVDRSEQARQAITSLGGALEALYWTQGAYDLVAVVTWPDEETAQAFLLTTARQGNLRSETLRAFSAEEMTRIIAKMP